MALSLRSPCLAGTPLAPACRVRRSSAARRVLRATATEDDSFARVAAIEDEIQRQARASDCPQLCAAATQTAEPPITDAPGSPLTPPLSATRSRPSAAPSLGSVPSWSQPP